jgi:hypothetical protein
MITSALVNSPTAVGVEVSEEELTVSLSDGRVVRVPLSWYPRLSNALPQHRARWEFIGAGHGIHWPELDEDISVENVLVGQPSGESARSFARWKEWYRQKVAEPGAAPNSGPATASGDSAASEGCHPQASGSAE